MNIEHDFNLFRKDRKISANTFNDYVKHQNGLILPQAYINPHIIEERNLNVASMDVFSRMLMDRTVWLCSAINSDVSAIISAQLLYLSSIDKDSPINMYLLTPGGEVLSGMSILDTMSFVPNKVNTLVVGIACSMGFVIAVSGDYRSALKHARLMQHQPSGGYQGKSTDMEINVQQMLILKKELYEIISEKTKQPYDKITTDCERGDYWMTAEEAKTYGAIDEVITPKTVKS